MYGRVITGFAKVPSMSTPSWTPSTLWIDTVRTSGTFWTKTGALSLSQTQRSTIFKPTAFLLRISPPTRPCAQILRLFWISAKEPHCISLRLRFRPEQPQLSKRRHIPSFGHPSFLLSKTVCSEQRACCSCSSQEQLQAQAGEGMDALNKQISIDSSIFR